MHQIRSLARWWGQAPIDAAYKGSELKYVLNLHGEHGHWWAQVAAAATNRPHQTMICSALSPLLRDTDPLESWPFVCCFCSCVWYLVDLAPIYLVPYILLRLGLVHDEGTLMVWKIAWFISIFNLFIYSLYCTPYLICSVGFRKGVYHVKSRVDSTLPQHGLYFSAVAVAENLTDEVLYLISISTWSAQD
jgi:hypothetical protein